MMEYRVRDMTPAEYPLLAVFLHMAIFVPPGQQPPAAAVRFQNLSQNTVKSEQENIP